MDERLKLVRRGLYLSILTVAWNVVEGIVALIYGIAADSVALFGFGIDSFIESASGVVVGFRFFFELKGQSGEANEKAELLASRIAGFLLLLLALYLVVDSFRRFFGFGEKPTSSHVGIALAIISLIVMPVLAKAKLNLAGRLGSASLRADAYETVACAWLSLTTLAGLVLNAMLGWWWADPGAALVLVPFIVREGLEGLRGEDD